MTEVIVDVFLNYLFQLDALLWHFPSNLLHGRIIGEKAIQHGQ